MSKVLESNSPGRVYLAGKVNAQRPVVFMPSAGVAPLRLSRKPDSMLIFGRDVDPQAPTAIGVRSMQISRKQGRLRRLADGTVECTLLGVGPMRSNGGYFRAGEARQLTVGDVLELLECKRTCACQLGRMCACPGGKGDVRKVVASWSVVEPPPKTPSAELPAAAPPVTPEAAAASALTDALAAFAAADGSASSVSHTGPLHVGQQVRAKYAASMPKAKRPRNKFVDRWYTAVVTAVHADGSCDVTYTDGVVEHGVLPAYVKALSSVDVASPNVAGPPRVHAAASGVHATAALPHMLDQACAAALHSAASSAAERVLQSCEYAIPRQAAVVAGASLTAPTAAKPVRPTELALASSSSSGALQTLNLRLCTAQRLATELRAALPPTLPTTARTKLTELARHLAAAAEAISAETEVEAAAVAAAAQGSMAGDVAAGTCHLECPSRPPGHDSGTCYMECPSRPDSATTGPTSSTTGGGTAPNFPRPPGPMQTPSPLFRPVDSFEATDFLEPQRKANSEFAVLSNSFKTDAICCDRCGKWRPWPASLPGTLMDQNDGDVKEDEENDEEEKDEDDEDDDEDDEEPWFCSMHDDPRYASCGALVHRIREGPEFQMTWLPPVDMQAPIIERADVLLQIDISDVPQSRPRNRGAHTAHRGRGKPKGKKYAAAAAAAAAGLPETDSQHFASAYEWEEIWAKDRAECAAKQAAREAKASRRRAARLAKAGGGMGAGDWAQEDDRIELQGHEKVEMDADDHAEDDVEDDVEDDLEDDCPDAASPGVSDEDAHDGGDGYDLFCTAAKPPSKRQRF